MLTINKIFKKIFIDQFNFIKSSFHAHANFTEFEKNGHELLKLPQSLHEKSSTDDTLGYNLLQTEIYLKHLFKMCFQNKFQKYIFKIMFKNIF